MSDSNPTERLLQLLIRYPLLPLLIALIAGLALATNGSILSWPNLRGVLLDAAVITLVAVPGALLIIAGYIDLSVGSSLALGGVVAGIVVKDAGSTPTAITVGIAIGGLVGLVNGLVSAIGGLSSFITTLATLTIVRGVTQLVSPLSLNDFGSEFGWLGVGAILGIPFAVWVAALVALVGALFLALIPAGRHVYAIGINPHAAFLAGVRVRLLPAALFIASGAAAGAAGVITAARLNSAPAGQLGVGFELAVLTAILLGGIALKGGEGTVLGVLFGVVFLGLLRNGLVLLGVQTFWQSVVSGIALIAAIALAGNVSKLRQLTARKFMRESDLPASEESVRTDLSTQGVKL
jgi:ribose transport system permease protein